jgi:hypothetical protein
MSNSIGFFEVLESRTLMSVTPFDSAVVIDRLHIQVDLLKLKTDVLSATLGLMSNTAKMKADGIAGATSIAPLITKLRTDDKAFRTTLLEDRLTEKANVLADESVVVKALVQIMKDKGNATAEAADHTALTADRVKLQTDMIAGLDQRITDRQAGFTTLVNDAKAIYSALPTAPDVSTKLATDIDNWLTAAGNKITTVTADLTKLMNDRQKLVTDLSAEI